MRNGRVLVVDDERGVRESIRMLLKDTYEVVLAINGTDAIAKLNEVHPDIVLLDLRMPDMSGTDVLQNVKMQDPYVEVILVTAYATIDTARKAIRLGAFDYITKPFNPSELENVVLRAFERRDNTLRRSATMEAIQQNYQSLRREVVAAKQQIETHVRDTVYALLMSLQIRDAYSGKHSMAVLWLADRFSQYLGLPMAERMRIKQAALIHDIGKIGIPEEILNKPEPLTADERETMQHHPIMSAEIISNVNALSDLASIVRAHHERWDGKGYPDGLAGENIPLHAQILAICDSVHAMSSVRCYRSMLPESLIREELLKERGKQFKPEYVDAMLESGLITEIFLAETTSETVLTTQQIRQVMDGSDDPALLTVPNFQESQGM